MHKRLANLFYFGIGGGSTAFQSNAIQRTTFILLFQTFFFLNSDQDQVYLSSLYPMQNLQVGLIQLKTTLFIAIFLMAEVLIYINSYLTGKENFKNYK